MQIKLATEILDAVDPLALSMATKMQSLLASQHGQTDKTRIIRSTPRAYPGLAKATFALPDVILDCAGRLRLCELNTSNGAGTSVLGYDGPRAGHQLAALIARGPIPANGVIVLSMSPDTNAKPEIGARAILLAALAEERLGMPVAALSAQHALPDGVVVVCDTIPNVADHLEITGGELLFRGRPVVSLANPNVLSELARRLGRSLEDVVRAVPEGTIHEGNDVALLGFDKIAQQAVAARTPGWTPVACKVVGDDVDEVVDAALAMAKVFGASIIKPLGASGGTGVIPVNATAERGEVVAMVREAMETLARKYGPAWSSTCPLAVFEWIEAAAALTGSGEFRWDLRVAVLATPDQTIVAPLAGRLAPAPVGGPITRANGVANITDREKFEIAMPSAVELSWMIGEGDEFIARVSDAVYAYMKEVVG